MTELRWHLLTLSCFTFAMFGMGIASNKGNRTWWGFVGLCALADLVYLWIIADSIVLEACDVR